MVLKTKWAVFLVILITETINLVVKGVAWMVLWTNIWTPMTKRRGYGGFAWMCLWTGVFNAMRKRGDNR